MKYRPIVVGITGSVGKTTTKDALAHILGGAKFVYASDKNFNNEFGLPFTILGCDTPGRSLVKWLGVGFRFLFLVVFRVKYPEVLILEMGVDRPGDMQYLLSIVKPDISIVTEVSASHLEFFGSLDAIAQEKGYIVEALSPEGYAILNTDDARVWKMRHRTKARIIGYGFHKRAHLRAFNESVVCTEKGLCGMRMKIEYDGKTIPVRLKHIIAKHHAYALLGAFAVADVLKINLLEVARSAEDFRLAPGRLQPVPGMRGSWIFDDTYNASPVSTRAALETLDQVPFGRKILVLGDMLELGPEEVEGHASLAKPIMKMKPSAIVLVGNRMRILADTLMREGYGNKNVTLFDHPVEAGKFVASHIRENDVILVKGSQGMRMELAIEEILADRSQSPVLLCRQSPRWKEIPFVPEI